MLKHSQHIMGSAAIGLVLAASGCAATDAPQGPSGPVSAATCDPGTGGIRLASGFCVTVFADNLGNVRHAIVRQDGVLYVNVWSGRYYAGQPVPEDGFLLALKDSDHDGKAETVVRYGQTKAQGSTGG